MGTVYKKGRYYGGGGGGHTILNASTLPMAGRSNLQFNGVEVEDDSTNNKTIIEPQIRTCTTLEEWNLIPDSLKNSPLIYWYLPFTMPQGYETDKTPVGTVISVATPVVQTGEFPSKGYLVCDGETYNISDYPQLAEYFQTYFGSSNYFGGDGVSTFKVPNWTSDTPANGILCIKSKINSDIITFAEVDTTGLSSETDKVPSCARVAAIEEDVAEVSAKLPARFSGETFTVNNASSKTITLPNNSVHLLVASSNIGEMAKLIFVKYDTISNITNLRNPTSDSNWTVTSSGLNLTIQNTSQYAMIATLYRLH